MSSYKLGKLPKRIDPRTLLFERYLAAGLVAPGQVHNGSEIKNSGMLGNDDVGDCAEAAAGHAEEIWYDRETGGQLALTTAQAIAMYSAVAGYVPGNESTDQGTVLLNLLNDWRKTSFYVSPITAYTALSDPTNTTLHELAIWLFGCSYIGLELPDSVLPTSGGIVPFTVNPAIGGTNAPNPANGHCIILSGYDRAQDMFWGMTWDTIIPVSGPFVRGCCDEAYALLSPQWLKRKTAPNGFNLAQLTSDLITI